MTSMNNPYTLHALRVFISIPPSVCVTQIIGASLEQATEDMPMEETDCAADVCSFSDCLNCKIHGMDQAPWLKYFGVYQ